MLRGLLAAAAQARITYDPRKTSHPGETREQVGTEVAKCFVAHANKKRYPKKQAGRKKRAAEAVRKNSLG